jgi:hypothetical protein
MKESLKKIGYLIIIIFFVYFGFQEGNHLIQGMKVATPKEVEDFLHDLAPCPTCEIGSGTPEKEYELAQSIRMRYANPQSSSYIPKFAFHYFNFYCTKDFSDSYGHGYYHVWLFINTNKGGWTFSGNYTMLVFDPYSGKYVGTLNELNKIIESDDCPNPIFPVVNWEKARYYIGKNVFFEGTVIAIDCDESYCYLRFDKENSFVGVIDLSTTSQESNSIEEHFMNQKVRIKGIIEENDGVPIIIIKGWSQLWIKDTPSLIPFYKGMIK